MTDENLSLPAVVGLFNRYSPVTRDKRTVQRWLARRGITGSGSSRHNWFYPLAAVEAALATDFPFNTKIQSRARARHAA